MKQHINGRPPHYKDAKELQDAITDYFENNVEIKQVIVGKKGNEQVVEIPVPTITGLSYHLGFESRQSFYDYEKRDGFSYTIKRARLFIEKHYEELLQTGNTTGAIFALKNFNWTDSQNLDLKSDNTLRIIRETINGTTD